jgi:N-acetylated-alpha-linked acidic dipeptidase
MPSDEYVNERLEPHASTKPIDDEEVIDEFVLDVEATEEEERANDRVPFFHAQNDRNETSDHVTDQRVKQRARQRVNPFHESLKSRLIWWFRDHWRVWFYAALGAIILSLLLYLLSNWSFRRGPSYSDLQQSSQLVFFTGHPYWHLQLQRLPDPKRMDRLLHQLTAEPHMSGTMASKRIATLIRDEWRAAGIPTELETFQVLLGAEPSRLVVRWSDQGSSSAEASIIDLTEPSIRGDPATLSVANGTTFHGYAASGTIRRAPIVYVNYGRPDDYAELERRQVNISGCIALIRYGELFRGLKVFHAQKRGAAAVLIYSDPGDDGAARGLTYPEGPWRPAQAVQRGSVQFNAMCVGDPSTPGYGSTESVPRRSYKEAVQHSCLPSIPSVPISAASAERLFQRMSTSWKQSSVKNASLMASVIAPAAFRGGFDPSLYVLRGVDDVLLDLEVAHEYSLKPIYNVIGRIPGAHGDLESDREIVFGNHHDAWVYGAVDPHTGTLVQMETVRAFGELLRQGWRPRRTLVFASWDAEEWGTIGSVEHVETNLETRIRGRTLAYLNADVIVSGATARIGLAGSPLLTQAAEQAMRGLVDPVTGTSLLADWKNRRRNASSHSTETMQGTAALGSSSSVDDEHRGTSRRQERLATETWVPLLGLLGGGSDHTAFLHHAGVSSLDVGFDELDHPSYPVYHSIYDDETYFRRFTDPDFRLHRVAIQFVNTLLLDLVDAPLLPMNATEYGRWFQYHLREAEANRPDLLTTAQQTLQPAITEFAAAAAKLAARRNAFTEECLARSECVAALTDRYGRRIPDRDIQKIARLNQALMDLERALLHPEGIPGRSWYRHVAVAPHPDKGYSAVAFPFMHGAVSADEHGLQVTAAAIQNAARVLNDAVVADDATKNRP